jgi:hypothetical protein
MVDDFEDIKLTVFIIFILINFLYGHNL